MYSSVEYSYTAVTSVPNPSTLITMYSTTEYEVLKYNQSCANYNKIVHEY